VPGVLHQGILSLLKDDPWLPFDLLGTERPVDGTPIDRRTELDHDGKRPGQIDPRFPDLVMVYRDPLDPRRGIVICFEAQKKNDRSKYARTVLYQALLLDEHGLPIWVVFVSFSRAFSVSARSWSTRRPPVDVTLLDVDSVPCMTLEQARLRPTAAVLAGALHGFRGNIDAARIAIAVIRDLPKRQRDSYTRTLLAALPEPHRTTLTQELPVEQRDELWEIERRSGTYQLGLRTGREQGLERGREQGRRATLVELILAMLDVRGIPVDSASKARIKKATLPTLERWSSASREVARVSELFDLESSSSESELE
jgi:hypothetical protein